MPAEVWFAVPGDPATLTGGYIYAARLTEALENQGWTVHRLMLPAGFPNPSTGEIEATHAQLAALPVDATVIIDGLAFGAFPQNIFDGLDLDIVALVHHPLAYETGVTPEDAARLMESERAALHHARAVISTSAHTADDLVRVFEVSRARVTVALPGIARPAAMPVRMLKPQPHLLTVATLTPRKGYDVLVDALGDIRDLAWRATWVGSTARSPETTRDLEKQITRLALNDRIVLAGETDELAAYYADADAFVLASRYEGYGMAFAEALAQGLPVIGTRAGAVSSTVPEDAGILVAPDDPAALAGALRRLLTDAALYERLAAGAARASAQLATWDDTARAVGDVLKRN
ncbi:MAG: glycosyltransferase family 4 protein [Candidatus Binataceae bacterium]